MSVSVRYYAFMSVRVSSFAVYSKARSAFRLSILILSLSLISLVTGILGQRYIYGIIANIAPLILPIIIFQGVQQKLWGKELLKTQCLLGTVYALTLIIMDSIMFAYVVTDFRYCYASWRSQCQTYVGPGSFDLKCQNATTSNSTELYITCASEDVYTFQMVCLAVNLLHALVVGPYLLICHGLKTALSRSNPTSDDAVGIGLDSLPIDAETSASKAVVILGNEEPANEADIVDGMPVSKVREDFTNESRDEILPPRIPPISTPPEFAVFMQ